MRPRACCTLRSELPESGLWSSLVSDVRGGTGRFLRDSQVSYLRYGLRLEAPVTLQKRALQMLCESYDAGRRISNPSEVRQLIHSHLGSMDVLVRRWAIKALALIGHRDDFQRIVDRLKVESDVEVQTWGVAGLVKNARGRELKEICHIAGLPNTSAFALAARLYAPTSWIAANVEMPRISLDHDELTLKWAIFLIGYEKAPEDLFHPRFSNELFLGELNAHDACDISEYSIWALWARPNFGSAHAKVPLSAAANHPESVRKWLYRLATKSPGQAGLNPDRLLELRQDDADRAREGLALGVADLDPEIFGSEVLEWYTVESAVQVRESLVVSMASLSEQSTDYADIVETHFGREQADSPVRSRLLAASEGTPLYANLRRIEIASRRDRQGFLEYGTGQIIVEGDYIVISPTLNVGGNLNAQNVALGDMVDSANAAVQQLKHSDAGTASSLQQVLAMLAASNSVQGRDEVVAAVEKVAQAPTPATKATLVEKIKAYASSASATGTLIEGVEHLIHAVQHVAG